MADLKKRFCDPGWFVQQMIGLLGFGCYWSHEQVAPELLERVTLLSVLSSEVLNCAMFSGQDFTPLEANQTQLCLDVFT